MEMYMAHEDVKSERDLIKLLKEAPAPLNTTTTS
jgi:hypothetical protein